MPALVFLRLLTALAMIVLLVTLYEMLFAPATGGLGAHPALIYLPFIGGSAMVAAVTGGLAEIISLLRQIRDGK